MAQTFKTRWQGYRVQIKFTPRSFINGGQGQAPCLTIKTSNSAADRLGLPSIQRYKVNPDIVETMGDPKAYAKKLLCDASAKMECRRQFQMTQQIPLFGVS